MPTYFELAQQKKNPKQVTPKKPEPETKTLAKSVKPSKLRSSDLFGSRIGTILQGRNKEIGSK